MEKNCGSCLKNYNFGNSTKDEIIEKYEVVLESREIQVTDLSMELGKIQERNLKLEENLEVLTNDNNLLKKENDKLATILKKKDYFLVQELQNKEHMFMRLQDKENECDEHLKKISLLVKEIDMLRNANKGILGIDENSETTKRIRKQFIDSIDNEDANRNSELNNNKIIIQSNSSIDINNNSDLINKASDYSKDVHNMSEGNNINDKVKIEINSSSASVKNSLNKIKELKERKKRKKDVESKDNSNKESGVSCINEDVNNKIKDNKEDNECKGENVENIENSNNDIITEKINESEDEHHKVEIINATNEDK